MASFNKIVLIGRLTKDPVLRYTPSGIPVGHFSLAVDRRRSARDGEKETDFIDIVVWQKLAEICQQYLTKGRLVAVEGRLQIRNYDTQDGQKRRAVEVIANDLQILDKPATKSEDSGFGGGGGAEAETVPEEAAVAEDVPF